MAFEDWKTDTFKKVDVRGVQGNFFQGLKKTGHADPGRRRHRDHTEF